jgi:hypothetical protein
VTFATSRYAETDVETGQGYRVESYSVQDETGAQDNIPIQVTRVNPGPDRFSVEAEEMLWTAPTTDLTNRQVVFDANIYNVNLRTSHDSIYPAPQSGDTITCTINIGVVVGSVSTIAEAFNVGSWPSGVTINLIVLGRIQGMGGAGGSGNVSIVGNQPGQPGSAGGPALYTRVPINLTSGAGEIWGGGGGGGGGCSNYGGTYGGGGGGGGAGTNAGSGGAGGVGGSYYGNPGGAGTATSQGLGGSSGAGLAGGGGAGGGPGVAGSAGQTILASGGAGGAAGAAIDGISYVNTITAGDIRGGQVN